MFKALSYGVPVLLLLAFNIGITRGDGSGGNLQTFFFGRELSNTETWVVFVVMFVCFLTVMFAARWLFKCGAALCQLDALEMIKNDARPPVLYLRSFDDDSAPDYTGTMNLLGARTTVEMRLGKVLVGIGPVVSIGRPGERLPELGTSRFYVSDADWQQAVLYFLERSAAVVIVVGRSTGVTWEITTALRNVPLSKLLLVFPYLLARENRTLGRELWELIPSRGQGSVRLGGKLLNELRKEREIRYGVFCNMFSHLFETKLPLDLESSIFLDFTGHGFPRLIPTRQPLFIRRARDRQGVTVDCQRTLRPFLEKLQGRVIQPDRIERFMSHRGTLLAITVVCSVVAILGFLTPFILGPDNVFGIILFFLSLIPASVAYYGVWNLWSPARTTESQGYTLGAISNQVTMPAEHLAFSEQSLEATPAPSLVAITHVVYALLALGLIIGIPAVLAVIINYIKRKETRNTYLDSHFHLQIRTFWFGVLWSVTAMVLSATVILVPLALSIIVGLEVWIIHRIFRGWLALKKHEKI